MKRFTITLLLASLLASCATIPIAAGDVFAIQPGSTYFGISQAVSGAPGTLRMMNPECPNCVVLIWNIADGMAFAGIDTNNKSPLGMFNMLRELKGNYAGITTFSELEQCLKDNGWKYVSASRLPRTLQIAANSTATWLVAMSQSMTTFGFTSAGFFNQVGGEPGPY